MAKLPNTSIFCSGIGSSILPAWWGGGGKVCFCNGTSVVKILPKKEKLDSNLVVMQPLEKTSKSGIQVPTLYLNCR